MEKESIIHKKWLSIELSIMSYSASIIKNKIYMKEYAEELGNWEVVVDKEGIVDESGYRIYEIKVIPSKNGKISPEEYRIIKDKLLGFALDLCVYLGLNKQEEIVTYIDQPSLNLLEAKKPEEVKGQMVIGKTLFVDYLLKDRLELEKKDINLAKVVFFETFEETINKIKLRTGFFNNIIQDKNTIKIKNKYKERLRDWFSIRIK